MALTERQNEILKRLKENKTAGVNELAEELYVSEATIRRDLAEMKNMGLIERSHGGRSCPKTRKKFQFSSVWKRTRTKKNAR